MMIVAMFSDETHTVTTEDLGIVCEKVIIGLPSVRKILRAIPYRDGNLDYTDALGTPALSNRDITIQCGIRITDSVMQSSDIINALHGRRMKIVLSNDPSFYYIGRISVSPFDICAKIGHFTLQCDCDPWKMCLEKTTVETEITDTYRTIELLNMARSVYPRVTVSAETSIKIGDSTVSVSPGSNILLELLLESGVTKVEVKTATGTGNIRFEYEEGCL